MAVCSTCGARNTDTSPYCRNCGRSLRAMPSYPPKPIYPPAPSTPPSRTPLVPILIVVAALVLIVGIVAAVHIQKQRQKEAACERTQEIHDAIQTVVEQDQRLENKLTEAVSGIKMPESDSQEVSQKLKDLAQAFDNVDHAAALIQQYVEQGRQVDTSRCPRDFAEARTRYLAAAGDVAYALPRHPHIPVGAEAAGWLFQHIEDLPAAFKQVTDDFETWQADIKQKGEAADKAEEQMHSAAGRYGDCSVHGSSR